VEIEVLSPSASLEEIYHSSLGFELSTVRVPIGNLPLVHGLEAKGFRFLESQFSIEIGLSSLSAASSMQAAILRKYVLAQVRTDEVELLQGYVKEGLFKTDRIALDPELGPELANHRYSQWIAEVASKRIASLQWLMTASEPPRRAGFIMFQEDGKTVNALLGGVFPQFQTQGAGLAMVLRPLHHFATQGFTNYQTKVSSNNFPVLRLYQDAGFKIHEIVYVMRRLERRKTNN
jgi:ribosomal protein S18 acetylase RimI-like enzyme